jgi:hypothetical protein
MDRQILDHKSDYILARNVDILNARLLVKEPLVAFPL